MKGYVYILLCANNKYYTGSTKDLETRLRQHFNGEGANFTKKHPPIELKYLERFDRIDMAFYREKQIQGWSRAKKEALIDGRNNELHGLSECKNESNYKLQQLRDILSQFSADCSGDSGKTNRPGVSTALNDRTTSRNQSPLRTLSAVEGPEDLNTHSEIATKKS